MNRGNLRTDKHSFNPVEFQTTNTFAGVGFASLYRYCSDSSSCLCLTVKIFFDYTFPCSSFDFAIRFERLWFKRQVASNPITMAGHNDVTTRLPFLKYEHWPSNMADFKLIKKRLCFRLFLNHYQQTRKISYIFEL